VQELTRRRLVDRKIVQYLIEGKGHRFIKEQLGIGSGRLEKVKQLAEQHGYLSGCPLPAYPEALFPDRSDGRTQQRSDTDRLLAEQVGFIEERLNAGWSPITVWEELPISVTRSSFYRFLERHDLMKLVRGAKALRVVPEIVHAPGEALILDWGKLCTVLDPLRAVMRTLWVLVGVLGFSRYLMGRLVWTNDVPTTLSAIEVMLREIQGVPHRATSDNPKCFCLEASRYEPLLNPAFERFAAHYAFSIECLPPRDPEKKGKIERMVPYVRRLYEAHGEFISLEESQAYLDRKLALANQRVHGTTRRKPIDDLVLEREHLRALPATAYEIEDTATATVRQDGHVRFANRYYSVEERFIGQEVFVLGGRERLAIYHRGKLIETHARLTDPYRSKQTKPEHLKPWERALADDSAYRRRARQLGPAVEQLIVILLGQGHGFIDTRKVWGILSLDKQYPGAAIDAACAQAIAIKSYSYRSVVGFLQREQRKASRLTPPEPKASHKFARDLAVYSESLALFPVDPPQGD
jgi:Mu transposase-like protein